MFIAAFASLILYTLVFLKLRGNLAVHGWRIKFRRIRLNSGETPTQKSVEMYALKIAKHMLL